MLQSDPVTMKRIEDKPSSCDPVREKEWLKHREKTVYLKFSQNQNLLNELKETTGKFVEASQHDSTRGIELALNNTKTLDTEQWRGENWLGNILTDIRQKYIHKKT